jgi:hypothetical protein
LDDLIVGAPYANPDGKSFAGKSYVVFGKINSSQADIDVVFPKLYIIFPRL